MTWKTSSLLFHATVVLFLAFISISVCAADDHPTSEDVMVQITSPEQLHSLITSKKYYLVIAYFYAPWCSYCKKFEPHYLTAARSLSSSQPRILFTKIDATQPSNYPLNSKYQINGFPTLKIFKQGNIDKPSDYRGQRTADQLISFLEERARPAATELTTREDVETFIGATAFNASESKGNVDGAVAVAFMPPKDRKALEAYLEAAASVREELKSAYVMKRELLEPECPPHGPGDCDSPVVLLKKHDVDEDDDTHRYEGSFEKSLLIHWLESHSSPLVAFYHQRPTPHIARGFQRSWATSLPKLLIIFPTEKHCDNALLDSIKVAARANDDLKFIITTRDTGKRLLKILGVPPDQVLQAPLLYLIENYDASKRYVKDRIENVESCLPEFIEEWRRGELPRFIKSQEMFPPEESKRSLFGGWVWRIFSSMPFIKSNNNGKESTNQTSNVLTVTANTYTSLVLNSQRPTFFMLYSPTCSRSQNAQRPFEELAAVLAHDKVDINLAKSDTTKNDILLIEDRIQVNEEGQDTLPLLYWLPPKALGHSSAVKFQGNIDKDSMLNFVNYQLGRGVEGNSNDAKDDGKHVEL